MTDYGERGGQERYAQWQRPRQEEMAQFELLPLPGREQVGSNKVEIGGMVDLNIGSATISSELHPAHNEDVFGSQEYEWFGGKAIITAVFDGMGGVQGGERAATAASRGFSESKDSRENISGTVLRDRFYRAVSEVANEFKDEPESGGGTAVAAVSIHRDAEGNLSLETLNLGDSRIYMLRGGELYQLSDDHDHVAHDLRDGKISEEQAKQIKLVLDKATKLDDFDELSKYYFDNRNKIGAAITAGGVQGDVEGHRKLYPLDQNDKILLCSDGLHDNLARDEIKAVMLEDLGSEQIAKKLLQLAWNRSLEGRPNNIRSKKDDISVQVIKVDQLAAQQDLDVMVDQSGQDDLGELQPLDKNDPQWSEIQGAFYRSKLTEQQQKPAAVVEKYILPERADTEAVFALFRSATNSDELLQMLEANASKHLTKGEEQQLFSSMAELIRQYREAREYEERGYSVDAVGSADIKAIDKLMSNTVRGIVRDLLAAEYPESAQQQRGEREVVVEQVDRAGWEKHKFQSEGAWKEELSKATTIEDFITKLQANAVAQNGSPYRLRNDRGVQSFGEIATLLIAYENHVLEGPLMGHATFLESELAFSQIFSGSIRDMAGPLLVKKYEKAFADRGYSLPDDIRIYQKEYGQETADKVDIEKYMLPRETSIEDTFALFRKATNIGELLRMIDVNVALRPMTKGGKIQSFEEIAELIRLGRAGELISDRMRAIVSRLS